MEMRDQLQTPPPQPIGGKTRPIPTKQENEISSEPVWTFRNREKSPHASGWGQTPIRWSSIS